MNNLFRFRQFISGNKFHYWGFSEDGKNWESPSMRNASLAAARGDSDRTTGLVDKNGKEIFENDLLKVKDQADKVFPVVWLAGGFYLKGFFTNKAGVELQGAQPIGRYAEIDMEIIGNTWARMKENSNFLTSFPMNTAKQKKSLIVGFIEELALMFGVRGFDRKVIFKEHDCSDGISAEITFDEPYQRIVIAIYPCFFKFKLDEQRKTLLHEFCHTITLPSKVAMCSLLNGKLITRDAIEDIHERETSKIENIIDNLLCGILGYASQAYKKYLNP